MTEDADPRVDAVASLLRQRFRGVGFHTTARDILAAADQAQAAFARETMRCRSFALLEFDAGDGT